jgi:hypothetical protein
MFTAAADVISNHTWRRQTQVYIGNLCSRIKRLNNVRIASLAANIHAHDIDVFIATLKCIVIGAQAKQHALYAHRHERKSTASVEYVSRERTNTGPSESGSTTPLTLPVHDTKTRPRPPPAYSGQ